MNRQRLIPFLLVVIGYLVCSGLADRSKMPDLSKIPTPPSFVHSPNQDVLYFVESNSLDDKQTPPLLVQNNSSSIGAKGSSLKEKRFECIANGFPRVQYRWMKDEEDFNLNNATLSGRITLISGSGSFILNKMTSTDAGNYKCIAQNDLGIAMDKIIQLKQAMMDLVGTEPHSVFKVKYGDPFKRDCIAPKSVPPARSYWIFSNLPTAPSRSFKTINFTNIAVNANGTIFFQYVTQSDIMPEYYYTCVSENAILKDYKFGSQFTFEILLSSDRSRVTLESLVPPTEQYTSPSQVVALRGQDLELFCIVSGYHDFIPKWSKNGRPLNLSRVSWGTNFKKSMKLFNVTYQDAGEYVCDFENAKQLPKRFQVSVESAPHWHKNRLPPSFNSSEGSTAEFNCSAEATPKPTFKFFRNGKELLANDRIRIYDSMLLIKEVHKDEDQAVYQCQATNKHGTLWANFYLNLLSFAPVVLDEPKGVVETVAGKDAVMECKVFGSPKPEVKWANKLLASGIEGVHYDIEPVNADGLTKLRLKSVKRSDADDYSCFFKNSEGNDSAVRTLVVRDATVFTATSPSVQVAAGKRLVLPCKAAHDPVLSAEYHWFHYGKPITTEWNRLAVYVDPDDHSLVVEEPAGNFSGNYTCRVVTPLDSVEHQFVLTVKDVPLPPTQAYVKCFTSVAEVSFYHSRRPGVNVENMNRTTWVVQTNIDAQEPDAWDDYVTEITSLVSGQGRTQVHLNPYGNYAFRVLAKNEVGLSPPTYIAFANGTAERCVTPPKKPEMNPLNVHIDATTPNNMIVSWEPVPRRDWYGENFSYVIQYRPKDSPQDTPFTNITINDPKQGSISIDNLPTFKEYEVVVSSQNKEGQPSVKAPVLEGFSGEDLPMDAPAEFKVRSVQKTSASFVWKPVDKNRVRGQLKGYKIDYWYSDRRRSASHHKSAFFDSEASEGVIYDLKPNRQNYATIRVLNNAGEGPASPTLDIEMGEGVPSAVQQLHVFPISHDEIGVMWSAPEEINGNMTGYTVTVCPLPISLPECLTPLQHDPHDKVEIVVDGLRPSTEYRVQVTASTRAGQGVENIADVKTTKEFIHRIPPLPPTLHNVEIGDTHINVTWKPGDTVDGVDTPPGREFQFKYRRADGTDWTIVNGTALGEPGTPRRFSATLGGLEPGVNYEIRAVSLHKGVPMESSPQYHTTSGGKLSSSSTGWLIALVVMCALLLIILCITCLIVRSRGAKYAVYEKEKKQGRDSMSKNEKAFGEYTRAPELEEEKTSLTANSKLESETDSMAEYGDGENGRFTEDGSFIGQYGPGRTASVVIPLSQQQQIKPAVNVTKSPQEP